MIKQVIQLTIIVTAALYCGMAGAHGKVSMEEDTCTRRLDDDSMVHLSAYQPQHASPALDFEGNAWHNMATYAIL